MKKETVFVLTGIFIIMTLSMISAEYSIDISGLKNSYSVGEKISYDVLLLENKKPVNANVNVFFSDDFGNTVFSKTVASNTFNELAVNESFSSKNWHVTADYSGKKITHSFLILEHSEVEFSIEEDKLIIRNKGNVRYTRDVQVKIGDEISTYTQNIPIAGEKTWILVAPQGSYNIEITDGITSFTKTNVPLNSVGTGDAIGAMSKDLGVNGLLTSPIDPSNIDKSLVSAKAFYISIVFILGVLILGILLFIERRLRK